MDSGNRAGSRDRRRDREHTAQSAARHRAWFVAPRPSQSPGRSSGSRPGRTPRPRRSGRGGSRSAQPTSQMYVTWAGRKRLRAKPTVPAPQIRYGPTSAYGTVRAADSSNPAPMSSPATGEPLENTVYSTILLTSLTPGTTYHYSVSNDGHTWSADAAFTTAVAGGRRTSGSPCSATRRRARRRPGRWYRWPRHRIRRFICCRATSPTRRRRAFADRTYQRSIRRSGISTSIWSDRSAPSRSRGRRRSGRTRSNRSTTSATPASSPASRTATTRVPVRRSPTATPTARSRSSTSTATTCPRRRP